MDKSQKSIIPFIERIEAFRAAEPSGGMRDFALWLLKQEEEANPDDREVGKDDAVLKDVRLTGEYPAIPTASGLAAYIVVRLFKALRFYLKPVLQYHGIGSIDEMFFLATLAWKTDVSKKTLCQLNMTDVPTGIDIIKRLLRDELVTEKENPDDKREKLLSLTDKGWEKIYSVFAATHGIQDVFADLPSGDRKTMLAFLDRLNHFHTAVYVSQTQ